MVIHTYKNSLDGNEIIAQFIPWDSATFGFNICSLTSVLIKNQKIFDQIWEDFLSWLNSNSYKIITARVGTDKKKEINFLQNSNFLVMENTCQPVLTNLQRFQNGSDIQIVNATDFQMSQIINIAETSFQISRFHTDSNVNPLYANLRYGNWVRNSFPSDNLKVATLKDEIVAFFLIERVKTESYWHLTAVSNEYKGRGYGKLSWEKMLQNENENGIKLVKTRISVENLRVLNLYSYLGARFQNSEVTLHLHL